MRAENNQFLLVCKLQILPQPFELICREAAFVVRRVVRLIQQQHIVHPDDMGIPPLERIVAGPEGRLEIAAGCQIVCAAAFAGFGAGCHVMVSDNLEERHADLLLAQHLNHQGQDNRRHIFCLVVRDDIAEGNPVNGRCAFGGMFPDIGNGLADKTVELFCVACLGIGKAEKREMRLDGLPCPQCEIVTLPVVG